MELSERVGTVQRTTAADLLATALTEGYIDVTEYDQRVMAVHAARTIGDIVGQLRDLPQRFHWDPRQHHLPAPPAPPEQSGNRQTFAALALTFGITSIPLALCFGIGAIPGTAAVLLARPAWKDSRQQTLAVTGAVLGLIGVALSILMIVVAVGGSSAAPAGR